VVKVYATLVKKGEMTIEQVPTKLRGDVEEYLNGMA